MVGAEVAEGEGAVTVAVEAATTVAVDDDREAVEISALEPPHARRTNANSAADNAVSDRVLVPVGKSGSSSGLQ